MAFFSKNKTYIDYDAHSDELWIFTGEKVKNSQEFDDFIVDFDKKGNVIGIEIQNFQRLVKVVSGLK